MGYPDAAFIHQFRMCADAAYAPVAANGLVFVPSNLRDELVALELATGRMVWRVVTGGPVRFAPVYDSGRLYFGSDDGRVYCVLADSGELLWKIRGVPDSLPTSRLLVNGRLTSRWPVRGGPVLYKGKVFFGAGIWPEEGVYVSAVDAETGKLVWRTDALSLRIGGMNDHGKLYDLGLPPQGYLAVINGKLAVPSGRSLAVFLDPETGEVEPFNCYYSKTHPPRGTWWLTGNKDYWIQGGNLFSTGPIDLGRMPPEEMELEAFAEYAGLSPRETLAALRALNKRNPPGQKPRPTSGLQRVEIIERGRKTIIKAPLRGRRASGTFPPRDPSAAELFTNENRPFLDADVFRIHDEVVYSEPVLQGDTLYNSILDDMSSYLIERGETYVKYPPLDRIVARDMTEARWRLLVSPHQVVRRLEFPVKWELATPHKVLIASGDRVVAGAPGEVIAIRDLGDKPEIVFRARIDGAPVNALVSRARLVVTTSTGKIYCFGSGAQTTAPDEPVQRESLFGKPYPPSFPGGYALVLGWGTGKLAEAVLRTGKHQVVVLEPNEALAGRQRGLLAARELYGRQIQIVSGDLSRLRLSAYWADLVVSEDLAPFASALPGLVLDTVRPFTGRLRVPASDQAAAVVARAATGKKGFTVATHDAWLECRRTSPPDGYDEWTHETAGPANTFANRDALVRAPLGLLWLSGYIDRFYTPEFHFQHYRAPYPLVSHGRMFLITGKYMNAVDVYTGNFLWKIEMPMTQRVQWRYQDSRVYSRPYERNYIATPDTLYIIYEKEIHRVSAATGEKLGIFTIPQEITSAGKDAIWTEVRLSGDYLCCVVGDALACLDRKTGKLIWQRKSTLAGTSYALGDRALFGVDHVSPPGVYSAETASSKTSILFRLDLKTGRESWTSSLQHATVPEQNPKQRRQWLLPITPGVIYNAKHGRVIVVVNRRSYYAFDVVNGRRVWEHPGEYSRAASSLHLAPMPLVADDIVFGPTADYASAAVVLDVRTGELIDNGTWLNYKRGCSRVIGNGNLLTYRNAATEVFDYENKKRLNFNSVRSGCTANFLPADGVLNAPSFGHGCVCNYPTFASLALVHMPEAEIFKPDAVRKREIERTTPAPDSGPVPVRAGTVAAGKPVDVSAFKLVDAKLESTPGGCRFSCAGDGPGYAVKMSPKKLQSGTLTCTFKDVGGKGRHKNCFLVLGSSSDPDDLIKIMIYHGGRKRLIISGKHVDEVERELVLPRNVLTRATVRFDLAAKSVSVDVACRELTAKITGSISAVSHCGYGGSNSDTFFAEMDIR
jgi:outer membrane protein assembly factor BamB